MAVSQRKMRGAWYTPPELVAAVAGEVLADGFSPASVLDPACGDGRFLQPFEAMGSAITGVDVDPETAFVHDDALRRDWAGQQFDAVVGNPPFLNQLATATTRGGRSTFGGGPYADSAAEFLALAVRLTRRGGRIGMVLPQSLLSTRDTQAIRAEVSERAALRWMWWSPTMMFDASVRVWAGVWEVGAQQREVRRSYGPAFTERSAVAMPEQWSGLVADTEPPPTTGRTLGEIAAFSVDFRQHYYGLVDAVSDTGDGVPLVTSGLIDPGVCRWGERPVRFAKQVFSAPRVALDRLSPVMRHWATSRLVPKILIANQTSVIEAVLDRRGAWLPSVPVITCVAEDLDRVLHILQSDDATRWVRYHAAGSGLSATTVRLTPSLLASIPIDPA